MITFIVPLQSPAVSHDWKRVSLLNERCLRSICAQTTSNFRVVLVCNQRPETNFSHSALTLIEEDFPLPADNSESRMDDKWYKLKRGMIQARQWGPGFIMFVDGDDCVSSRLAGHVEQNPSAPGWIFEKGYIHDEGSRWIFRRRHFHQYCGTSSIVFCREQDFPTALADSPSDYVMLDAGHRGIAQRMRERDTPLQPLPFPGAVYNTGTGENYTGISLRNWRSKKVLLEKLLSYRPLTRSIRDEFCLYDLT